MRERMRETALLLRIQLCRLGGVNSLIHGHDRRQRRRAMMTLALTLMLVVMAAGYSAGMAAALAEMGAAQAIPQIFALAVSALALGTVMLKGPEVIFGGGDVPALRAAPVHVGSIVASRFAMVLGSELAFALLIGLPAGIVYGMELGAAHGVRLVLALCLLPAIPTVLALAVGTLALRLTLRMRRRAAVSAVLNIVLLMAILGACGAVWAAAARGRLTQSMVLLMLGRVERLLSDIYPPADWAAQAAAGHAGAWLPLAGTALLALALMLAGSTAGFARIADALAQGAPVGKGRADVGRRRPPLMALYVKEARRYASSSIYMMNTMAGWLMYAMMTVAVCVTDVSTILAVVAPIPGVGQHALSFLPVAAAVLAGMSATTPCSISMEGRQLDTLRAMPVRKRDWLGAKLLLSLTVALPPIVLCGAALSVRLHLSAGLTAALILAPLGNALLTGAVGLALNLRFPKLDWEQEVEAVKQGVSVLLTILFGMIVPIACGAAMVLWG